MLYVAIFMKHFFVWNNHLFWSGIMESKHGNKLLTVVCCQKCSKYSKDSNSCDHCQTKIPANVQKFHVAKVRKECLSTLYIEQKIINAGRVIKKNCYHVPLDVTQDPNCHFHQAVLMKDVEVSSELSDPESLNSRVKDNKKEKPKCYTISPDKEKSDDSSEDSNHLVKALDKSDNSQSPVVREINSSTNTEAKSDEEMVVDRPVQRRVLMEHSCQNWVDNSNKDTEEKSDEEMVVDSAVQRQVLIEHSYQNRVDNSNTDTEEKLDEKIVIDMVVDDEEDSDKEKDKLSTGYPLQCHSIRIGTYRVYPTATIPYVAVNLQEDGLTFTAPVVTESNKHADISLRNDDITQLVFHFGIILPIMFVYTTPNFGESVRKALHMVQNTSPYFDPSSRDEKIKRLIFLFKTMTEDQKLFIRQVFPGEKKVKEIDEKTAREILVLSTPASSTLLNLLWKESPDNQLPHISNQMVKKKQTNQVEEEEIMEDEKETIKEEEEIIEEAKETIEEKETMEDEKDIIEMEVVMIKQTNQVEKTILDEEKTMQDEEETMQDEEEIIVDEKEMNKDEKEIIEGQVVKRRQTNQVEEEEETIDVEKETMEDEKEIIEDEEEIIEDEEEIIVLEVFERKQTNQVEEEKEETIEDEKEMIKDEKETIEDENEIMVVEVVKRKPTNQVEEEEVIEDVEETIEDVEETIEDENKTIEDKEEIIEVVKRKHTNQIEEEEVIEEEEEEEDISEDEEEMIEERVHVVFTLEPVVKLFTYPPPPQIGGITVTNNDFNRVITGHFLNDVIIDFYLKYIFCEKLSTSNQKKTHIFSSFFYSKLTQKRSKDDCTKMAQLERHNEVKTWTRHVDIFSKDYIIIPINMDWHWFLAIICFPNRVPDAPKVPGNEAADSVISTDEQDNVKNVIPQKISNDISYQEDSSTDSSMNPPCIDDKPTHSGDSSKDNSPHSDGKEEVEMPCICIFDSVNGFNRWRIVRTLREYLEIEWKIKKGTEKVFDKKTMKGFIINCPKQTNCSDCGLYLLEFTESFFYNPIPFAFPMPDLTNWFTKDKINKKRKELGELILNLQKKLANTAHKIQHQDGNQSSSTNIQETDDR